MTKKETGSPEKHISSQNTESSKNPSESIEGQSEEQSEEQSIDSSEISEKQFPLNSSDCDDLRKERLEENKSYMDLSEDFGESAEAVAYHITGNCSCDNTVDELSKDRPWTEEELLRHLLLDKNMHYTEIGDAFGCHQETVKNWASEDRFDITVIDNSERVSSKMVRIMHRKGVEMSENEDDDKASKIIKRIKEAREK